MARQARIVVPCVPHHVTQRRNNRQDVFFVDDDRRVYLSYLKESAARYGVAVWAYCLMTNHVHLVATPENEASLSKTLGRTHLMYAQYIHRLHGRVGHFWQSRFYSCALDEVHAVAATAYVELNPVRAGMAESPFAYRWSSAAAHCGQGGDRSGMLDLSAWFEQTPATEWEAMLEAIRDSKGAIDALRVHARTGRLRGGDAFLSKVETYLGCRIPIRGRGRPKGSKDKRKRKRRQARQLSISSSG